MKNVFSYKIYDTLFETFECRLQLQSFRYAFKTFECRYKVTGCFVFFLSLIPAGLRVTMISS